jgi:hypothetical protein
MKIELKELAGYLPYGLKVILGSIVRNITAVSIDSPFVFVDAYEGSRDKQMAGVENIKPILHPLSDLLKEIEHNREKFTPIEWFEIGDDENASLEYDYGNIKLTKTLKSIAKHNCHNDINYLPYGVVQKFLEWHFDIFGWIEKGLAIDINTLPHA